MKNSFLHIVETDSIDLLKNKIEAMYPDIKQILEYDINETGTKKLLFEISSNPLVRVKRAFIVENLFTAEKKRESKSLSLDKNPRGAVKYLYNLAGDTDIQEFIDEAVNRMDKKTYSELGLDKIVVFSKRQRLQDLLDMDISESTVDVEKFLLARTNEYNLVFIVASERDDKGRMENMLKISVRLDLVKGKKGFGYQPVNLSVKSFISEYARTNGIRITDHALSLLCEFTSNKIDAIKNELGKLKSLVKDSIIDDECILENVKKESTADIFHVINQIFDSDFNTSFGIIMDIYRGSLIIEGIDRESFIFVLLPQMTSFLHHALFSNEIISRYNLKDIEKRGYNYFKANTYPGIAEQMKKEGRWISSAGVNILASHPYRAYQVFRWARKHNAERLQDIVIRISELDKSMKSSKANIKNNLFDLISMIYF